MLQVEVAVFSGRPNPTWFVTDPDVSEQLLDAVARAPAGVAAPGAGLDGLGYREVRVGLLEDDQPVRDLPREFALGTVAAEDLAVSGELARQVIETMPLGGEVQLVEHATTPLSENVRETVLDGLEQMLQNPGSRPSPPPAPPSNPLRTTVNDADCERCDYEVSQYNPGFWNTPGIQPFNNCYNYARNWRTNTFAQPGRAHGAQARTMSCDAVTNTAMADGLRKRCDCLADSEYPRRLMALVIWPGVDYHWYRQQRDGFWGHKPGQTAARNYDENGALVVDPETAERGGYTDFCGYFYAGRSVLIN